MSHTFSLPVRRKVARKSDGRGRKCQKTEDTFFRRSPLRYDFGEREGERGLFETRPPTLNTKRGPRRKNRGLSEPNFSAVFHAKDQEWNSTPFTLSRVCQSLTSRSDSDSGTEKCSPKSYKVAKKNPRMLREENRPIRERDR